AMGVRERVSVKITGSARVCLEQPINVQLATLNSNDALIASSRVNPESDFSAVIYGIVQIKTLRDSGQRRFSLLPNAISIQVIKNSVPARHYLNWRVHSE